MNRPVHKFSDTNYLNLDLFYQKQYSPRFYRSYSGNSYHVPDVDKPGCHLKGARQVPPALLSMSCALSLPWFAGTADVGNYWLVCSLPSQCFERLGALL